MKPDAVCAAYAEKKRRKKLTIQTYKEKKTGADMVLIEGEADALEFLGNVLLAQAKFEKDCGFFSGRELQEMHFSIERGLRMGFTYTACLALKRKT